LMVVVVVVEAVLGRGDALVVLRGRGEVDLQCESGFGQAF